MIDPRFIHLRVHSAYSLSEGAIRIKDLVKLCAKADMPAIAVTDTNNLYGALEFSMAATDAGLQSIIGCQVSVAAISGARSFAKIVLLVQSDAGYRNLLKLVSRSHLDPAANGEPHLKLDAFEGYSDGLICLTGGAEGPLGQALQANQAEAAEQILLRLKSLFTDRLYVELMRHGLEAEQRTEPGLIELAYQHDLPLVATNDCYFADAGMHEAHDALLCIAEGAYLIQDDRRKVTPHHRFKTGAEMAETFADLPEAIANTVVIAQRCAFLLKPIKPILPKFAEGDEAEALREKARAGLEARLEAGIYQPDMDAAARKQVAEPYYKRLEFELSVIISMKFPGYFLIVADFIQWAKAQNIPVGPGRGSGAGSVVAWALTITNVDPLVFGLIFERFLNPERVSMPDFDVDFCQDRRDEVIKYVRQRYGNDRVAQIITFGKLQARAVLRDVGRVMQMPYGQIDRISKMIPNNPAKPVTLADAIAGEPQLQKMRDEDEQVARLMDTALKLEGLYRHASTHAAGVVISDRPLDQLVPLYRDPKSDMPVTQFSMKYVESGGLVKFDFLGLTTLTILKKAEHLLAQSGIVVDVEQLPLTDKPTYDLLTRAEGMGVFQVESAGMKDALRRIKPSTIDDIVALVALYRPGPMDNIPVYGRVKDGTEPPTYLHPLLEPILKETFGVITYQEHVMQIAQVLAGYSMGGADLLRRAMGKKIRAEMEVQQKVFLDGAAAQGLDKALSVQIWELMAKFADYGFPKGHAAPYALLTYQTAWLKANHPVEFIAACMTLGMDNTDKLAAFRQELQRMKIPLLPPDLNRSGVEFAPEIMADGTKAVRYALAAVKGVGAPAMAALVAEREAHGPYKDLNDLAKRIDAAAVNKRQIENLAFAGAFDTINSNRAQVAAAAETVVRHAASASEERASGQVNLFGGAAQTPPLKLPLAAAFDNVEKLRKEFAAVGFYLTAHPLDASARPLERLKVIQYTALAQAVRNSQVTRFKLAGVVIAKQERTSQRGKRFAFLTLSDVSGIYEITIFSELLGSHRELMEPGQLLVVEVDAQAQEEGIRLTAQGIEPLDRAIASVVTGLRIVVNETADLGTIKAQMQPQPSGRSRIVIAVRLPDHREASITLPPAWSIAGRGRVALEAMPGVLQLEDL